MSVPKFERHFPDIPESTDAPSIVPALRMMSERTLSACRMVCSEGPRAVRHSLERQKPVLFDEPPAEDAALYFPEPFLRRQKHNECGPYAAAAHVYTHTTRTFVSPEVAGRQMQPRLPDGCTYPRVYEEFLRRYGIDARSYDLRGLSAQELFGFFQRQLIRRKPVSVLTKMHGVQHYCLILGAWMKSVTDTVRKPVLDLYDPLLDGVGEGLTSKLNGPNRPGNRTVPMSRFAKRFAQGGAYGLYKGLAITEPAGEE